MIIAQWPGTTRHLFLAACMSLGSVGAFGQQPVSDSIPAAQADSGGSGTSIIPFPFVFYTPETKIGFGGTVITMFRLSQDGGQDPPSSLSPIFVYTQKKQIVAMVETELFFGAGRYRLNAGGGYSKFPNTMWGIGNDTPDSLAEDYTPQVVNASVQFQNRVSQGWYVGGRIEFARRKLVEVDSAGLLEQGLVPGTDDGHILSAGLLVTWDTRDNTVNPTTGGYRQARVSVSDSAIGSDYDFSHYSLDLRQYVSIAPGHVLAFRGLGMATGGTQPFDVMPQIGGEQLLRGYYGGRYRDRNLVAVQAEYRAHVWKRLGAVGFVSAGRVSDDWSNMDISGFKPAIGLGLRFLLAPDEGLNLRADFGFGKGSSGFYLGMGEVF